MSRVSLSVKSDNSHLEAPAAAAALSDLPPIQRYQLLYAQFVAPISEYYNYYYCNNHDSNHMTSIITIIIMIIILIIIILIFIYLFIISLFIIIIITITIIIIIGHTMTREVVRENGGCKMKAV